MSRLVYRYDFSPTVDWNDVQSTLTLAILATEALHGETSVQLDAGHFLDEGARACIIESGTVVSLDINKLFAGFLRREFGADSFHVRRVSKAPVAAPTPAAA